MKSSWISGAWQQLRPSVFGVVFLALTIVAGLGPAIGNGATPSSPPGNGPSSSSEPTPSNGPSPSSEPTPSNGPSPSSEPTPSNGPSPIDAETQALVVRLRAPQYTADTTLALEQALARAGIATQANMSGAPVVDIAGPPSPLRLLDFQAHSLAVDAWRGRGLRGATLDAMLPVPTSLRDQVAPASALLAGYVAAVDTPGARLARGLMAGQDLANPAALLFPQVVPVLFASDLATDAGPSAHLDAPRARAGSAAAVATFCSDAAGFIDQTLSDLFVALKVSVPSDTVGTIVASIWNWVVDQGKAFVQTLLHAVTDAVLSTVRAIAGTIAAIADEVASVVPFAVTVQTDPAGPISLGGGSQDGTFIATVSAGELANWPPVLRDCASQARVALPSFRGRNEPMAWGTPVSGTAGLVSFGTGETRTDGNGEARLPFRVAADPGTADGQVVTGTVAVDVLVHNSALDKAQQALSDALFSGVPALLRGFVSDVFASFVKPISAEVSALIDARGSGSVRLLYHGTAPGSPSPRPSSTIAGLPDPCTLMTDYEAEAASRVPAALGMRHDDTIAGYPAAGCIFRDEFPNPKVGPTAHVSLYLVRVDQDPAGKFRAYEHSYSGTTQISGLGDDAFAVVAPTGETLLFSRVGSVVVDLAVLSPGSEDAAIQLMLLILGRL